MNVETAGNPHPRGGEEAYREYDIIWQFFAWIEGSSARAYELIIGKLDQGLGYYEAIKYKAKRDIFNPIAWIAFILRIPSIIIEKTGLVPPEKGASFLFKMYALLIRGLILIILALLAAKLGVSIPWNVLFKF